MYSKILTFFILLTIGMETLHSQNGFTTNNNELEELYERYSILYPNADLFADARPYNRRDIGDMVYNQMEKDSNFSDPFLLPYLNN